VVVDVTSVEGSANDVSEVVEVASVSEAIEVGDVSEAVEVGDTSVVVVSVGDESVSGTAEEGSKAVDVGAASVVDRASVVDTAKDESVSVEEGLVAATDGEMPATVEE
jgi:purine-nucleoside phosphorylase